MRSVGIRGSKFRFARSSSEQFNSILCALFLALLMVCGCGQPIAPTDQGSSEHRMMLLPDLNMRFGFDLNRFFVETDSIKPNQFLADILLPHGMSYRDIANLSEAAEDVFSVKALRAGKGYAVLTSDTTKQADYFVYEPNRLRYVIYDLKNFEVSQIERPVERRPNSAQGVIESSLWLTMMEQDLDYELAAKMEDALAWAVDFHHIQKGDHFKVHFEELYVDGERVGVGDLHGAYFSNSNNDHYAIKYASEKYNGYYDLQGRPMKKVFLKAPLKYTRISSSYNPRRFHPVLRRVKAHLGTDYAAPRGTPIYAVANGRVTKRGFTKGNGNYVKIKHDKTYSTQYLHMSRFAKDVVKGTQVVQGQVIGYVGSTGLATGPHVCFRFWKNGKQVNHLKENLPEPEPMAESELPDYFEVRDSIQAILDAIDVGEIIALQEG
ncbi:MAG: peptidoglycan DD-metalloendopeptidase family protein [Saprospiraceae bacterium]|nr:peptidoglycan DD-metalloendopeptidase family protein [Saprospiraceae bacterium]